MMTTIRRELTVQIDQTRVRATPPPAGRQFRDALGATGVGVLQAIEQAAGFVPGGATVSAAVRGAVGTGGGAGAGVSGAGAAGGGTTDLGSAITAQGNQALELLELQQQMAVEQRQFQTLSNVMKARHDTAKSVIQNVR